MSSDHFHPSSLRPVSDSIAELEVREPKHVRVLMHNDDYTTMEFVVQMLTSIFHKSPEQAHQIMLHIHEKGRGECGVYPSEVAETKVAVVHAKARGLGFPLRCTLEDA